MRLARALRYITSHPLTVRSPAGALTRFLHWQLISRIRGEVIVDWIADTKLAVRRGMHGATGNIYCGLHEYEDMAFLIHLLREGDLFLDIGANVGTYTVLASGVCGARTIAVEPDREASRALRRNLAVNDIGDLVRPVDAALGADEGTVRFTVGRGTINRVAATDEGSVREVRLSTVDSLLEGAAPTMIKIDVEGYEAEVFKGAKRTLAKPELVAIVSEASDEAVTRQLEGHGFRRRYYDPVARRLLRERPGHHSVNALFIRDHDRCADRIKDAPKRRILGTEI